MKIYRVVFMGTPIFAAEILQTLLEMKANIEIVAVVTQPDRQVGRQKNISFSPVKTLALQQQLKIFQPEKINDLYSGMIALNPDAILTCAYGQFIPERILKIPTINSLNIHASLLPRLRGGAPIHKAIIYGEQETGISLIQMVNKMDAGKIYAQEKIKITSEDTTSSLHDNLIVLAKAMIKKDLINILENKIIGIDQDDRAATFAYNVTRDEEKINWYLPKQKINDQIRGLYAWPIAYTTINNVNYKIHQTKILDEEQTERDSDLVNGTIVDITKSGIKVKVEDGYILIMRLQREGKTVTEAKNYFQNPSNEITIGNVFV